MQRRPSASDACCIPSLLKGMTDRGVPGGSEFSNRREKGSRTRKVSKLLAPWLQREGREPEEGTISRITVGRDAKLPQLPLKPGFSTTRELPSSYAEAVAKAPWHFPVPLVAGIFRRVILFTNNVCVKEGNGECLE